MGSIHQEALRESACDTLESLAFTELSDSNAPEYPVLPEFHGARISLGEDGELDIYLSHRLLEEIASVLYCMQAEQMDKKIVDDTLLEVINILAGRYMSKIREGKSDFTLGLPELLNDVDQWRGLPVRLTLESGPERSLFLGLHPSTFRL